jgi:predicted DNA-binding protein
MTISLRLEEDLARRLEAAAKAQGISKSEFIRQCVGQYLGSDEQKPTAWEAGKHLFGRHGSGRSDLSERCEEILMLNKLARDAFRSTSHMTG